MLKLGSCEFCGSDHRTATKSGYPATFVFEGDYILSNDHVHIPENLIKYLDFNYMIDYARMSLGFLYELAFAKS